MSTTNKFGEIIKNVLLVQGYESIRVGELSTAHIAGNTMGVGINEIVFKPWLIDRVPAWFSLDTKTQTDEITFISNTLGLSGAFLIGDKIKVAEESYTVKSSIMKGISVSAIGLLVSKLAPPVPPPK